MEKSQQTMGNKVAICRQRRDILLSDAQWKEVVYNKIDVNHDLLSVLYNPLGNKGEMELYDIYAYIQKYFGNRVYFYINKDIEGLKNAFSITIDIQEQQILE